MVYIIYYQAYKKLLSSTYLGILDKQIETEKSIINELYCNKEWEKVINYFVDYNMTTSKKALINKSSFTLSQRLKNEMDIEVFPIIEPHNLGKHWANDGTGICKWHMYTKDMRWVASACYIKDMINKKNELRYAHDSSYQFNIIECEYGNNST